MGGASFEHDARVEIPQTPELERVVGRLEDTTSAASSTSGTPSKTPGSGFSDGPSSSRGKNSTARSYARSAVAAQFADSTITARPPFMSLAPSPTTAPPGDAARQVRLGGNGVGMAGQQDERPAPPPAYTSDSPSSKTAGSRTARRRYSVAAASEPETDGMSTSASARAATGVVASSAGIISR